MSKQIPDRKEQGELIAQAKGSVKRLDKYYVVTSQTGNGSYNVELTELGFICSCPDHLYRGVKCKHIHAVEFSFAIREQVRNEIIISPIDSLSCRCCGSASVVKKAIRYNKYGNIQRYLCNNAVNDFRST
jgi:putative transposase